MDKEKRGVRKTVTGRLGPAAIGTGKPHVYDMIGKKLRDYFDEVAKQPVPDRFVELLRQLEAKTSPNKEG